MIRNENKYSIIIFKSIAILIKYKFCHKQFLVLEPLKSFLAVIIKIKLGGESLNEETYEMKMYLNFYLHLCFTYTDYIVI